MTPNPTAVDREAQSLIDNFDLQHYLSLPEADQEALLFALIDFLPTASFGSPRIWENINEIINQACEVDLSRRLSR